MSPADDLTNLFGSARGPGTLLTSKSNFSRSISLVRGLNSTDVNRSVTNSAYPDALTMREARDHFLASDGFCVEDYSAPTYTVKFWRLPIRFPNTKAHQWATPLHDLHHILTRFRTDWIGEAEIAAWELRAGCKTLWCIGWT